eukprot:tig00021128_g18895.t1
MRLLGVLLLLAAAHAAVGIGLRGDAGGSPLWPPPSYTNERGSYKSAGGEPAYKRAESAAVPQNWAVLVAGSRGWWNYRHQADVSHAYQILHKMGFPDSNIITMMYDDLAWNPQNPFPGNIINQPGGKNVYVRPDYGNDSVSADNLFAVLRGRADRIRDWNGDGKPKVLRSGPMDRVLVYFSDHGAVGMIAMPDGSLVFAKDLVDLLLDMYRKRRFRELVFYMEACESGSMFEDLLPDNARIFATTAANAQESSYACYFDDARGTYLGDLYSVSWLENTEATAPECETLEQQFKAVRNLTRSSHVMQFGDLDVARQPLSNYMAFLHETGPLPAAAAASKPGPFRPPPNPCPARDAPLEAMVRASARLPNGLQRMAAASEARAEVQRRRRADALFAAIGERAAAAAGGGASLAERPLRGGRPPRDWRCYKHAVREYVRACGAAVPLAEYALKYAYVLANFCEAGLGREAAREVLAGVCGAEAAPGPPLDPELS